MTRCGLVERLINLIELQAEIIREQNDAIEQLGAIVAEDKMAEAAREIEDLDIGQPAARLREEKV